MLFIVIPDKRKADPTWSWDLVRVCNELTGKYFRLLRIPNELLTVASRKVQLPAPGHPTHTSAALPQSSRQETVPCQQLTFTENKHQTAPATPKGPPLP